MLLYLARYAGAKINQILRCDGLPSRVSQENAFFNTENAIKCPLLTKLVVQGGTKLGLFLFCILMDHNHISFHKQAKKKQVSHLG